MGSVAATAGVATFSALTYTASADQPVLANDQDGVDTDPTADANAVTSDVVATQLAFTTQPAGSVSGAALTTQPVVTAQDADGTTDTGFTETITLTEAALSAILILLRLLAWPPLRTCFIPRLPTNRLYRQ